MSGTVLSAATGQIDALVHQVEVPRVPTIEDACANDWLRWVTELARRHPNEPVAPPHPTLPGGLPEGWTIRYGPWTDLTNELFVVHRDRGGWILVSHVWDYNNISTVRLAMAATLFGLYETMLNTVPNNFTKRTAPRLARVLAARYDLTNPVEAAEATLVALGGPLKVMPKAVAP